MKRICTGLICILLTLSLCSCGGLNGLKEMNDVGDKLILSIIHTIETDDLEGFSGLFLPSFLMSNQKEIERFFSEAKEYYQGEAVAYANQLFDDPKTRSNLKKITNKQISVIEPLETTEAFLNHQYYVETTLNEYRITFSWVQNQDKSFGLTEIYIYENGIGLLQEEILPEL